MDSRRGVAFGGALALLVVTATGAAQPLVSEGVDAAAEPAESPEARDARDAFVRGTALAREGRWNEALAEFEASERLRPHPVTAYNVGYVERALGHYTRARGALRRALAEGDAGKLPEDLAAEAREYLEEVERKIARVRVTADGVSLSVDGRPLELEENTDERRLFVAGTRAPGPPEPVPVPVFDLLVDPGAHVVSVRDAAGRTEAVQETAEVGGGNQWTFRAPRRAEEKPKPPAPKPSAARATPGAPAPSAKRKWAYVAFGVGAAGLAFGTTFGLLALDNKSDLDALCTSGGACEPSAQNTIDAYDRNTTAADIGFAVALAGAGLGVFLILTDKGSEAPSAQQTTSVRAGIGPSGATLAAEF